MTFFKDLDTIMKQDFGNRGLLKACLLYTSPVIGSSRIRSLSVAQRALAIRVRCFCPVSYTHLDVYKRQGGETVFRDAGGTSLQSRHLKIRRHL